MSVLQEYYNSFINFIIPILWGQHTFVVLLGVGLLFTLWSKFVQFKALSHGTQVVRGVYDDKRDPGAINHFQALSAALSATVGLGNIGGVALAIGIGGPGALFWMWIVGFLGMAIKSVEVTLAMLYRDTSDPDDPHGGAMWVIKRGFGDKFGGFAKVIAWLLGAIFCVTLLISTMTGGNMFQSWNVANITNQYFGIPQVVTGIVLASIVGAVIIGGIKRIGAVAGRLVPFMCGMYLIAGIVVLIVKAANIPDLLIYIVKDAFSPTEATGAFLGATAWFGLTTGLRRALFSNEAGQGSSPIAHSAAKTDEPAREGIVAGLEPFIDTCLVCTLTALVILSTGTWNREAAGSFAGPITLTQSTVDAGNGAQDITIGMNADIHINQLPTLPAPDYWAVGNGFFLVAEVEGNATVNTKANRFRLNGTIAQVSADDLAAPDAALDAAAQDAHNARRDMLTAAGLSAGDLYINWGTTTLSSADWENPFTSDTQIRLADTGIYRDFAAAALTGHAFDRAIPGLGKWLVTAACWLFAISTMISWSYYGEQGVVFLFGKNISIFIYKLIFCALTIVASLPTFIQTDTELGNLADLGTGAMLFANVPIIVFMAPLAIRSLNDYFRRLRSGEMEPPHKKPRIEDVVEGHDVE